AVRDDRFVGRSGRDELSTANSEVVDDRRLPTRVRAGEIGLEAEVHLRSGRASIGLMAMSAVGVKVCARTSIDRRISEGGWIGHELVRLLRGSEDSDVLECRNLIR